MSVVYHSCIVDICLCHFFSCISLSVSFALSFGNLQSHFTFTTVQSYKMMYSKSKQFFLPADWGDHCLIHCTLIMSYVKLEPSKRLSIKYLTHSFSATNCPIGSVNVIDWFVACDSKTKSSQLYECVEKLAYNLIAYNSTEPSFIPVDWLFILFIFHKMCGNSHHNVEMLCE